MAAKAIRSLRFDIGGVFIEQRGLARTELQNFAPQLETARRELLDVDLPLSYGEEPVPPDGLPTRAGFIDWPKRLLAEYNAARPTSQLHLILQKANCLRDTVDRVVVLGTGGSHFAAKALMDACCDPYFNELTRGQRGSRPRMYFEGHHFDNDASQGLLSLLGNGRLAASIDDRWAIVVVDESGETLETAIAFRQFLVALRKSCAGNAAQVAELIIAITGKSGKLARVAKELGCNSIFSWPFGVGDRYALFTAAAIVPAAILGIDVVKLLEGAIAMNEHFRNAPPDENIVMQWAAIRHLLRERRGVRCCRINVCATCLESVRIWYDQLLGGAREGESRAPAQPSIDAERHTLWIDVVTDQWRCDPLKVGQLEFDHDELNKVGEKTLPQILGEIVAEQEQTRRADKQPFVSLHLPIINAASMGQFFQMLMLAAAVEGQLGGSDFL